MADQIDDEQFPPPIKRPRYSFRSPHPTDGMSAGQAALFEKVLHHPDTPTKQIRGPIYQVIVKLRLENQEDLDSLTPHILLERICTAWPSAQNVADGSIRDASAVPPPDGCNPALFGLSASWWRCSRDHSGCSAP